MSNNCQDWETVVFKKSQNKTVTDKDIRTGKYTTNKKKINLNSNNYDVGKMRKLDNAEESFKIEKVSLKVGQQIQKARLHKKMTQKQLAQQINVHARVIIDYESGKAIPNEGIKKKIEKTLVFKITK